MQHDIEELFRLITYPSLAFFKQRLHVNLVNTARKSTLYEYYTDIQRLKRSEVQHEYLIHEAIKIKSVEALMCLLHKGADLLQRQQYDRTEHEYSFTGKLTTHQSSYVSGTALQRITIFADLGLLQATFDYVCEKKLYDKSPEYVEFLAVNLPHVNRSKFRIEFLNIDVGRPYPDQFEDTDAYKKYLTDFGFDLSPFYFYRSQYQDLLISPGKADSERLKHALEVCEFSLDELKALYQATNSEASKWAIYNHNSLVDPGLAAQLAEGFEEEEAVVTKKRALSPDVGEEIPEEIAEEEQPPEIAPHFIQDYHHQLRRIAVLTEKIANLRQQKTSAKVKSELASANKSLKYSHQTLLDNPYYQLKKASDAEDEQDELNKSPSL